MSKYPYRKGANAFVVLGNEFLIVQKSNYGDNQWDVPGGGIDEGESVEEGMIRELTEELGTDKFEVLGQSDIVNRYDWPDEVIQQSFRKKGKWYGGQDKYQFLVKFTGNKEDIKFQKDEIKKIKWITEEELKDHLVFEGQWENAKKVLNNFRARGLL